ncbi:hypothetical protein C6381_29025 [Pseudomonas syringae pv. actinidiae]|nr:hypothetical protein C6381_29025 [Pseudomonas syringae pv. actinidiae]
MRIDISQPLGVKPCACQTIPAGDALLRSNPRTGVVALQRLNQRCAGRRCLGVGIDLPQRQVDR